MSRDTQATNIRVGIFLAAGLLILGVAIFTVGQKSGLFEGKVTIYVNFADINGLVDGAPVRLAGLDVGTVQSIRFPEDLEQRQASVALSIKSRYMSRIREDSIAFIDSKGLLGDKLVNITLGSVNSPPLQEGGTLRTKSAPSIEHLATTVEGAIAAVTQVTNTADLAIKQLTTEQVRRDVGRIAASVANILEEVETGRGLAHGLLYEDKYGDELHGALADTRGAIADLRAAIARVDRTVASVEHGEGLAHELLYGDAGKQTMTKINASADDFAAMMHDAREGDGLLHALLFDPENAKAVTDLREASASVNRIMGEIERGRGTLGGLVVDPSVYEDLKTVLGNVERSVLLKALIRFTIKEGDIERPANVPVRRVEK